MKLRKGQQSYKIPAHFQIMQVFVEHKGVNYVLRQALVDQYMDLRDAKPARPIVFFPCGNNIMVRPKPDRAYKMTVRYIPPVAEV